MPCVNKGVPVVKIDGMTKESIGERSHRRGRSQACAPDCRFFAAAYSLAVIQSDGCSVRRDSYKSSAERVQDMHLRVGENLTRNRCIVRGGDKAGHGLCDRRWRRHRALPYFYKIW